jgi:hypothetical protein
MRLNMGRTVGERDGQMNQNDNSRHRRTEAPLCSYLATDATKLDYIAIWYRRKMASFQVLNPVGQQPAR